MLLNSINILLFFIAMFYIMTDEIMYL